MSRTADDRGPNADRSAPADGLPPIEHSPLRGLPTELSREAPRPPSLDSALASAITRSAPLAQPALRQAAAAAVEAARFRASGNQVRAEQWTQRVEQTLLAAQVQLGPPELRLATALELLARGELGEARAQLAASGLARTPEDWQALNAVLAAMVPERYRPHPDRAPVLGQGDSPADAAERARLDALSPSARRHDASWYRILQTRVPTAALQRGYDTTAARLGQEAARELVAAKWRAAPERSSAPEQRVMDVLAELGQGDPRKPDMPTHYEREYFVPFGPPGPVDFARPDLERAIEVHGGIHYGFFNQDGVRALKDQAKLEQLVDAGWSVLILTDRDLLVRNLPATRAAIAEFWAIERMVLGSRQEVLPW